MPPASYQLDTVAANLIERLEGARRTWIDDPEAARAGLTRIAEESVDRAVADYGQVMGADGWGPLLRRELLETFLPRYLRLAVAQNALEAAGFGAWRGGDPVARVVTVVVALALAALARRVMLYHPVTLVFFVAALSSPIMPELRAWHHRRRYQRALQEAVDDLERIQGELDRHAALEDGYATLLRETPAAPRTASSSTAPRTPQTERQ